MKERATKRDHIADACAIVFFGAFVGSITLGAIYGANSWQAIVCYAAIFLSGVYGAQRRLGL